MVELGNDPFEVRRAKREAQSAEADCDTLAALVEDYSKRHLSRLKRGHDTKSSLDRYVVSRWSSREVQTITRREIRELMDDIADEGKHVTANRIRTRLSAFFNWCIERDLLEHNPVIGTKRLREKSRDRILSDNEIRWFWHACEDVGEPWGVLGRILLLTGQRRSEVAHMSDTEFAGDVWTLPAGRSKNGRTHELPLPKTVLDIIFREPRVVSAAGFLFTTNGNTPVSGFSKGRRQISDRMAEIAAEERGEQVEIHHWTFHDLRRTASTGMTKIGISVAHVEAVLNHVSGSRAGVAGIYNRHAYREEKRQALEAWASEVVECCTNSSAQHS
jgi:integrase